MSVTVGIDMGASFIKGVLIKDNGTSVRSLSVLGKSYRTGGEKVFSDLLEKAGAAADEVAQIGVTGIGDSCLPFRAQRFNQIKCLVSSVYHLTNGPVVVTDLGGQAGRVCLIASDGGLEKFQASESCASGSGKLLENVSNVLGIPLAQFGALSAQADHAASFTTGCAVFAESEAISAVAAGEPAAAIIAGCHHAVANKIMNLLNGCGFETMPVVLAGGGALNSGLIRTLEAMIGHRAIVPEHPQYLTAAGAAMLAAGTGALQRGT